MSDTDEIERAIVEVKNLGKNSREIIYKQLRKTISDKIMKLEEIKNKIDESKFNAPFKKRKRDENCNSQLIEISDSSENNIETDDEEYDPNYPNDYEKIKGEEERIKKERVIMLNKLKKQKKKQNKSKMDELIKSEDKSDNAYSSVNIHPGLKGSDKVKKMLVKMGWKGQGLGKYEQGIVTPLIAKKTSDKYGIIINANLKVNDDKLNKIKCFYNRPPTKVLMITNMIYPEEINAEVHDEIRLECENFGFVNDIKFFQFTESLEMQIGEKVRVFIEYDSVDSAVKAFEGLYDRYFNERIIRVKFYDEEMYYSGVLDSLIC